MLNCSSYDKMTTIRTEFVYNYNYTGLLCDHTIVAKIGYMIHWGVAGEDYTWMAGAQICKRHIQLDYQHYASY